MGDELADQGKSPFLSGGSGRLSTYPHTAFHLNVERFGRFLETLCDERGIELVNDRIVDVRTDGGEIERVEGEAGPYEADLYLDATGFDRVLMGELDNAFHSFDFPLDAAVFGKRDLSIDEIVPATVVDPGEYGWFWRIDTTDWRDRGYVYASDFTSMDAAIEEFLTHCNVSRSAISTYRFESGVYNRAWVGNCVAVGNALGFVEPLQSTALTTNAILVEKLATLLSDHYRFTHRSLRELYDDYARTIWENIYEFISIHYRHAPPTSDFWAAVSTAAEGPSTDGGSAAGDSSVADVGSSTDRDRTDRHVQNYHRNGFTSHRELGGDDGSTRRIFNEWQFYRVLRGMGVRSDFYESVDVDVSPDVETAVDEQTDEIADRATRHLTYEQVRSRGLYE